MYLLLFFDDISKYCYIVKAYCGVQLCSSRFQAGGLSWGLSPWISPSVWWTLPSYSAVQPETSSIYPANPFCVLKVSRFPPEWKNQIRKCRNDFLYLPPHFSQAACFVYVTHLIVTLPLLHPFSDWSPSHTQLALWPKQSSPSWQSAWLHLLPVCPLWAWILHHQLSPL